MVIHLSFHLPPLQTALDPSWPICNFACNKNVQDTHRIMCIIDHISVWVMRILQQWWMMQQDSNDKTHIRRSSRRTLEHCRWDKHENRGPRINVLNATSHWMLLLDHGNPIFNDNPSPKTDREFLQQSDQLNHEECMQIADSRIGYGHGLSVASASDHSNQTLKQQNIIQTPFPSVKPKTHKTPLS